MRILFLALFLFSCSGQWHLRQALKKDKSILQTDTVYRPVRFQVDTLIQGWEVVKKGNIELLPPPVFSDLTPKQVETIIKEVPFYIQVEPVIIDTLGVKASASIRKGKLILEIRKDPEYIVMTKQDSVAVVNRAYTQDPKWLRVVKSAPRIVLWIIGIAVILGVVLILLRKFTTLITF